MIHESCENVTLKNQNPVLETSFQDYWPIRSSSRREKDVVKGMVWGYRYFSQLQVYSIRVQGISGVRSK